MTGLYFDDRMIQVINQKYILVWELEPNSKKKKLLSTVDEQPKSTPWVYDFWGAIGLQETKGHLSDLFVMHCNKYINESCRKDAEKRIRLSLYSMGGHEFQLKVNGRKWEPKPRQKNPQSKINGRVQFETENSFENMQSFYEKQIDGLKKQLKREKQRNRRLKIQVGSLKEEISRNNSKHTNMNQMISCIGNTIYPFHAMPSQAMLPNTSSHIACSPEVKRRKLSPVMQGQSIGAKQLMTSKGSSDTR